MKCPKCHYLSFEPAPRCRNCGFDLGMADDDLAIRPAAADATGDGGVPPLVDLDLQHKRRVGARRAPATLGLIHPAREAAPPPPRPVVPPRRPAPSPAPALASVPAFTPPVPFAVPPAADTPSELPLFAKGVRPSADELALAALSLPPRAPLSVRRARPELSRPQPVAHTPPRKPGPIDRDLIEDLTRLDREASGEASARTRLAALATDWGVLVSISGVVVWASLRVAGAGVGALSLPVLAPLAAFLVLVHFGYFFLFTAGNGQTPGKMAFSLRVVDATAPESWRRPPSVRQTIGRVLLAAVSSLLLGAGFLPALVGRGLSVHDRVTQTRIVRA